MHPTISCFRTGLALTSFLALISCGQGRSAGSMGTGGASTTMVSAAAGTGGSMGSTTKSSSAGSTSVTATHASVGVDAGAVGGNICTPDGSTRACMTTCGSTGIQTCASSIWGPCVPPKETCNLQDDDCNGQCDDLLGCRVGVTRLYDSGAKLHFYTTSDGEADASGYAIETLDYYYLYASSQPGLVPFYRCVTPGGAHLYTTDASCGGATSEGSMGFIATQPVCGAVPLYELANASGDHLYTLSSAEVSSEQANGYVSKGPVGYVWPGVCGGSSCTWSSPVHMVASASTTKTGFPTAWYGFPIESGPKELATLTGSVTVHNWTNQFAETLFLLQFLPSGACATGRWPATTPEYGPPGAQGLAQFIVKAPTTGDFTVPINLTLPPGLPMSSCVLLGLNGGPVIASHQVTSYADLTLTFAPAAPPAVSIQQLAGEFCYGQTWGCQKATADDTQSFAIVTPVSQASHLLALYGDISDSTFDGTSSFGALPAGAWTASNDFYVYHGSECSAFGVGSGPAGPGNYRATIPTDAVHLLSVPLSGQGIGVSEQPVFKAFTNQQLNAGDCLVALWGLQGGGGFDNETQVFALVGP